MNMLKDLYNRFINDYPFIQVISCAALAVIIFILLLVILFMTNIFDAINKIRFR